MAWQLLTAISVVTFSISMLLQRLLLHKEKSDPIAYVIVFQGLVSVLLTMYALTTGFHWPDFGTLWFPILGTVVLFGGGHILYAHTLRQVEASVFAILFATYALWAMVMSVLLFDDPVGISSILGTIFIFASIALLTERKGSLTIDKGTLMGLLIGVIFGFATVCWVYVGRHADTNSWNALSFAGPALFVLLISPRSAPKLKLFLRTNVLIKMSLLGIFYSIAAVTQLTAFKRGSVSLVAPLLQTSIIVTTLLAVVFLHERKRLWTKAVAAIACFIGVVLIVST
jgi:drug/metabolite transporter (DMT)-like permease